MTAVTHTPASWLRYPIVIGLAGLGASFFFLSRGGYPLGFPRMGSGLSPIAALSLLSLLGAIGIGITTVNRHGERSSRSPWAYAAISAGVVLTIAAEFVSFPVGCNLAQSCPGSPVGTWSTVWPNALTTCIGIVVFSWGSGISKSRNGAVPGVGLGLIISGFVLVVSGLSIGYSPFCPINGCAPLTSTQWWSLFWPDVIAEVLGVALMVAGTGVEFLQWLRMRSALPTNMKQTDFHVQ